MTNIQLFTIFFAVVSVILGLVGWCYLTKAERIIQNYLGKDKTK